VPEIDFAFLADAADARPGQKFHVIGGGVDRLAGQTFPLVHPHLALVIGLRITAPELNQEHDVKFVLLDRAGREVTSGSANLMAQGDSDGRHSLVTFAVDLWNLSFTLPGDYTFRVLIDGSERKRLPLTVSALSAAMSPPTGRLDA
jgi:hypothetical protein